MKGKAIRIVLAMSVGILSFSLEAALSARSYIQEGLIGQYDGEFNQGHDVAHSDTATTWKDLTGRGPAITRPSDAVFTAKSMQTTRLIGSPTGGPAGAQYSAPELLSAFSNASITVEVAFNKTIETPVSESGYQKTLCKFFILGNEGFWVGSSDDTHIGWNCNGSNGTDASSGGNLLCATTVDTTVGGHTLSCSQSGRDWTVRFDELVAKTGTNTPRTTPNLTRGFRFNRCWYEKTGLDGHYHSLRYYNRPLSADEALVNRAVDRVRFFGADPAGCTLPTGWRFTTTCGVVLERMCQASVSVSGGGTVAVNDGSPSETADFWAEYGGESTVLLSAVPAAGFRFVRWRGIVDDAEARSPSGTKHVTGNVVAVFCRIGPDARKLTARSYILDGLIGQWDGEYNQGYDVAHGDTAMTWKELTGNGPNIAVPSDASFSSMGLETKRATGSPSSGSYSAPLLLSAFSNASITVEVAFNKTIETTVPSGGHAGTQCKFFILGYDGFWTGTSGDTAAGWNCNGSNGTDGSSGGSLLCKKTVDTTVGEHTLSCSQSGKDWSVRFDELAAQTGTNTPRTTPSQGHGFRFNRCYYASNGLDGFYYSMRFYDRPLETDELIINRAVDRVRFFGADPLACELPDGWRFDMSDGIALERLHSATSSDPVMGLVSVNGGTPGESCDLWVEQGVATEVTLKAIPAKGYKFKRWEGNVVSGNPKIAEGVFTVSGDVRAVFTENKGLMMLLK